MQNDEPLSGLLREWKIEPQPDPTFRARVWQRVTRAAGESWSGYLQRHLAVWSLLGIVTLTTGGWIGLAQGQARSAAAREKLVASYIQSIDPRAQAAGTVSTP